MGCTAADCRAVSPRSIEQVQLGHKRRATLRSLSKGTLQRVGIAQAILNRPQLLILDEPMSGLDPVGRHAMRELIRTLHAAGTTVIFSSHILPDAEVLCDRVAILTKGKLCEVIDLRASRKRTRLPAHRQWARHRNPHGARAARRLRADAERHRLARALAGLVSVGPALDLVRSTAGSVESLVPVHPSLEERFLHHVGIRTASTNRLMRPSRMPDSSKDSLGIAPGSAGSLPAVGARPHATNLNPDLDQTQRFIFNPYTHAGSGRAARAPT
jgi:ABC-2 type transport system ATP-binding protein